MPATALGRRSAPASVLLALCLAASSGAIAPVARAATVPGAPTGVIAGAGDAQASVEWTAPASDGGSPITGYVVLVSPDEFGVPTEGTENWADIYGLTNGRTYTFTVIAINAAGPGPASAPSNSVVPSPPLGPPGAPRMVTAAAGDRIASMSWLPPSWDGGEPITQYFVYAYDISGGGFIYLGGIAVPGSQLSATFELCNCMDAIVFHVIAENVYGWGPWSSPSSPVVSSPGAPTPQTATALISPAGGAATTDPAGTGPTPSDPVTTSVTVPATPDGGTLSIAETGIDAAPTGFVFFGQQVEIVSTAATDATHPLTIVFHIDPSLLPATIFRNGIPVETACDPAGTATPSPCIAAGAGTASITILTATASTWNVGLQNYAFSGFFSPVDNQPILNGARAGSAIPIKFSLGLDRGLTIFAPGYPRAVTMTCDTLIPLDEVEEIVPAGRSGLSYDAVSGRYTYVWKTDPGWAGTCRQLVIRLADGSEYRASFTFRK